MTLSVGQRLGQRFLINVRTPDATTPITVILNWHGL